MTKSQEECFVIMPISDPDGYSEGHFKRVYDDIIAKACEGAGFNPIRADDVLETNLIHLDVLKKIIETPMAICDLSSRNPNVLFELGLRQAFDKPVVLIQEKGTPDIFDIALLRYTEYRKERVYHEVLEDQAKISEAITATKKATATGKGVNSMVQLLSLTASAQLADFRQEDSSPMMQVLMSEIAALRQEFRQVIRSSRREHPDNRTTNEHGSDLSRLRDDAERHILGAAGDEDSLRRGVLLCEEGLSLLGGDYRGERPPKGIQKILQQLTMLRNRGMEMLKILERDDPKLEL